MQDNQRPFGEGDGAYHLSTADYMSSNDRSINRVPEFIYLYLPGYNRLVEMGLTQPPQSHLSYAISQIIGGHRFLSVYLFMALTSVSALGVFFIMRKLYGFYPAVIASFGSVFYLREMTLYLWGQRPTVMSFILVPIIIYAYYKWLDSYYNKKTENLHLYLTTFLLGGQFLIHPQGFFVSFMTIIVYSVIMAVKYKALMFKGNLKNIAICAVIFLVMVSPFLYIYTHGSGGAKIRPGLKNVERLFEWGIDEKEAPGTGFPATFFSFEHNFGTKWMILFVVFGLLFVVMKRTNKNLLMLSWFIAVYLTIHFDVFGISDLGRVARGLVAEGPIFFCLAALGIMFLASFVKVKKDIKNMGVLVLALILFFPAIKAGHGSMEAAYRGVARVSEAQLEVAEWIDENLPLKAYILQYGVLYPKERYMEAVAHRYIYRGRDDWREKSEQIGVLPNYVMIDYTDFTALNNKPALEQLKSIESNFVNATKVYDKKGIKVFTFAS